MITVSEVSWKFGWNRSCGFGEFLLKNVAKYKISPIARFTCIVLFQTRSTFCFHILKLTAKRVDSWSTKSVFCFVFNNVATELALVSLPHQISTSTSLVPIFGFPQTINTYTCTVVQFEKNNRAMQTIYRSFKTKLLLQLCSSQD